MAETTAIVTVLEDADKDAVIIRFQGLSRTISDSMPNSESNFKITCDDSELAGMKAEADVEDVISQGELDKLHIRRSYTVVPFSQTINPDTSSTPNGSAHNWGLSRCTQLDNTSLGTEINLPNTYWAAIGYICIDNFAIRIDVFEKIFFLARKKIKLGPFLESSELMNPIGCNSSQLSDILSFCGFESITLGNENRLYFYKQKKIMQKQDYNKKEKNNQIIIKKKKLKNIHKIKNDPNSPFAVLQKLL